MKQQAHPIIFSDKNNAPGDAALKKALGALFVSLSDIRRMTADYEQEWKCYTKSIGWQLKASKASKALYWLTPLDGAFRISFSLRESERAVLMRTPPSDAVKADLVTAQKYPEGYALRFLVTEQKHTEVVKKVLSLLVEMRGTK